MIKVRAKTKKQGHVPDQAICERALAAALTHGMFMSNALTFGLNFGLLA